MKQYVTNIRIGICLFSDRGKWCECHWVCIYFWTLGNDILAHGNLNRVGGLTFLQAWKLWTLYIYINDLQFFYARLTTCTLPILFLSMVIMFCIFASFKQNMNNEIHWSCRSHDRKWPGKQKISRVVSNYSPGIREAKLSLGRLD